MKIKPEFNYFGDGHRLALIEGQKENYGGGKMDVFAFVLFFEKMRKRLSNIGAFVVLVLMILLFGSLYIVTTFLLAVVVRLNVWLSVAISGGISLSLAYACACLVKKIGIKLEL